MYQTICLTVSNYLVLLIVNPFLSCPDAFYVNRWSNRRSLFNKIMITSFLNRVKTFFPIHCKDVATAIVQLTPVTNMHLINRTNFYKALYNHGSLFGDSASDLFDIYTSIMCRENLKYTLS